MNRKVLIVDDDRALQDLLRHFLISKQFEVKSVFSAEDMMKVVSRDFFNLIILDIMLPGQDGLKACTQLRAQGNETPILMLTAKGDEFDRIVGLEMGCDDYLSKPFNPRELLARVNAIIKRYYANPAGAPEVQKRLLNVGDYTLDTTRRCLTGNGKVVDLSTRQYGILVALVSRPRQTLSRDELVAIVRKKDRLANERSIDIQVSRIRKIVEDDPKSPKLIQTVWGLGYVFIPDETYS